MALGDAPDRGRRLDQLKAEQERGQSDHRRIWTLKGATWAGRSFLVVARPELGAEGRDRTADTGFFRPVLYQLSYLGPGNRSGRRRVPTVYRSAAGGRSGKSTEAAPPSDARSAATVLGREQRPGLRARAPSPRRGPGPK